MKLRGTTGVALALLFALPACSEEDTVLSINVNLSASELNRQADLWEPIQVEIAKGRNVKQLSIEPQIGGDVEQFDASGERLFNEKGEPLMGPGIKDRFFERVTLDSSFAGEVIVTARGTGAYKISETVEGKSVPKSIDGYEFVSGSDASDAADADDERYTISVRSTPTPIEEEGVSTVFLDFRGPGPEPEEPPPAGGTGGGGGGGSGGGGGGSDSAGAAGEAPSTGGSGGNSTGGSDTGSAGEGGSSEPGAGGSSDGGTSEPGAGGEPASAGSADQPPAEAGSGGSSG
ncbi:MAG: hypothetical protein M3020_29135 [Myxococcota bacterium]|nr:hypothetical protein [Myxococcota bacterium]